MSGTKGPNRGAGTGGTPTPPRYRKLGPVALAKRIVGEVWNHPNNEGRRVRAVTRSLAWQVEKRIRPRPRIHRVYRSSKIWLDPDMGSASNLIYFGDRYDPEPMAFLEHLLRAGDTFVDIGANIGTYSILAAEVVGPTGKVHAFEAAPRAAERLRANVELNEIGDIVEVHQAAVADEPGIAHFRVDMDVSNRLSTPGEPADRSVEVDVVPLDSIVRAPVQLIKIDVEGAEMRVLAGAEDLLTGDDPPTLLIEAFDNQLKKSGSSIAELRARLADLGYQLVRYRPAQRRIEQIPDTEAIIGDVIAVPEARLEETTAKVRADA